MEAALPSWKREAVVRALMSLRGVALLSAMTLVAEAGDMTRFDSPTQLMSYFGLTPSEYSSGEKRHQGGITKAGNGACRRALVEAAHHYRVAPRVTPAIQKRQEGQSQEVRAIALKAQQRLNGRFRLLTPLGAKRASSSSPRWPASSAALSGLSPARSMPPTDSKLKQLRGALPLPRVLPPRAESTC